jgi:hypothetical protein
VRAPESRGTELGVLRRIWSLLGARRRRQMIWLLGVSLSMGASTLGGIAVVFPFFAVLADPRRIERSAALSWLYAAGGFADTASFLVVLGLLFAVVVLLANAVNLCGLLAIYFMRARTARPCTAASSTTADVWRSASCTAR